MEVSPDLWPALATVFGLFLIVGFFAQLIDGAVGMAYGVVSSSVLLFFGLPPAQVSALVHIAKCFTNGASGISHLMHRNVDWRLLWRLSTAGILGGVVGAYLLTSFDPNFIKALIVAYLSGIGAVMLVRAVRAAVSEEPERLGHVIPIGIVGGYLDASVGGGWGPVVTSTLLGRGHRPRMVIGSVNTAEFFVTVAISATFIWTFFLGRLELGGVAVGGAALGGLVIGGLVAAPLAGYITKIAPPRLLLAAAALLVIGLSIWQGVQLWPHLLEYPIFKELAQTAGLVNP
jgi:uncharacterized membrane protein YfcA